MLAHFRDMSEKIGIESSGTVNRSERGTAHIKNSGEACVRMVHGGYSNFMELRVFGLGGLDLAGQGKAGLYANIVWFPHIFAK